MRNLRRKVSRRNIAKTNAAGSYGSFNGGSNMQQFRKNPCVAAKASAPIIRRCLVSRKEFDNRKGAKTFSPEHLKET